MTLKLIFPDDFENWETLEELEDLEDQLDEVQDMDVDDGNENITDTEHLDQEANQKFICKCGKTYVVKPWFDKHTAKCKGEPKQGKTKEKTKSKPKLTEEDKKLLLDRKEMIGTLANLGFDEYFESEGFETVKKLLQELTATPEEAAQLRGHRFVNMLSLSALLLRLDPQGTLSFSNLLKELASKIWNLVFGRDRLKSSEVRLKYVFQHFFALRVNENVVSNWVDFVTQLVRPYPHSQFLIDCAKDSLLLQKILRAVFSSITLYRYKHIQELVKSRSSVADSECVTISVSKNEEYVIRYIAGYVCKSIRTKSLKYVQVNSSSSNPKVLEEVKHRKVFIDVIPVLVPDMSGSNIPSCLDYSRLLVDSLNKGGLHIVDVETFRYFRQLEFTIKPHLNIRQFRCTKLSTEKSLILELCENCKVLRRSWFRALFLKNVKVDTSFAIDDLDAELLQFF